MEYVFTDGGAVHNGKKSCKAGWAVFFNDGDSRNQSGMITSSPSNQKAELYAIMKALEKTADDLTQLTVVTDSQYSINCLTKWSKTWKSNGWKTADKKDVKHSTVIKECCDLIENKLKNGGMVMFQHINSHKVPPLDKSSVEYQMWYGNFKADEMVNKELGKVELPNIVPKGKVVNIDWDGQVVVSVTDAEESKMVHVHW